MRTITSLETKKELKEMPKIEKTFVKIYRQWTKADQCLIQSINKTSHRVGQRPHIRARVIMMVSFKIVAALPLSMIKTTMKMVHLKLTSTAIKASSTWEALWNRSVRVKATLIPISESWRRQVRLEYRKSLSSSLAQCQPSSSSYKIGRVIDHLPTWRRIKYAR